MTDESSDNASSTADPNWAERISSVSPKSLYLGFAVLLVLLTALAYSNTLSVPFILDDIPNIKESELVTRFDAFTLENIKRFWISRFEHRRPVARFTFALNYCFGRFSPAGYHVVNILIHILSGIGVFFFTRLLLLKSPVLRNEPSKGEGDPGMMATLTAGVTALIWTLHPVQTASVTYIVQRMTALAGMFYFWGLYFYLRRITAESTLRRWGFFFLTVIFFFLGLGSKEIVATLPFAIWLLHGLFFTDQTLFGGRKWIHFGGILLFFGAIGAYFLVWNQGLSGFMDKFTTTGDLSYRRWSIAERLMTEWRIVLRYLVIAVVPVPQLLNFDRYPTVSTGLFSPPSTFISAVIILGFLLLALKFRKKNPVFSFSVFWFGLHLVITSTLLPLELMFDHRLYLPLFGPVFFLVYLFLTSIRRPFLYGLVAGVLVPVLLGISTYMRNLDWVSKVSVYRDVVEKTPRNPRGHRNLAVSYYHETERLVEEGSLDRAYRTLQKTKRQYKRAMELLAKQGRPANQMDRNGLNKTHVFLAYIELERGNLKNAFAHLEETEHAETGGSPGMAIPRIRKMIDEKNYKSAIRASLNVLSRMPENKELYLLIAGAYLERNRPEIASEILGMFAFRFLLWIEAGKNQFPVADELR